MNAPVKEFDEITGLIRAIGKGTQVVSLSGLTSTAAKAFVLARLQERTGRTFVVVTDTNKDLDTFSCDLEFWTDTISRAETAETGNLEFRDPHSTILTLPSFETEVYSGVSPHAETQERRAMTLWRLRREKPDFLVVSAKALVARTAAPDNIESLGAVLERDEDFSPGNLVERLVSAGYVREDPINNFGQFSIRGGIVDVWSPDAENPVRIEFFGDTVDSIREFDPETQLSINQLKEMAIAPMREFAASPEDMKDWAFFARERFADERFARNLKDRTDFADEGETFSGWEFLLPLSKPSGATVFDYLGDVVFVIDEPPIIEQTLAAFYEQIQKQYQQTLDTGDIGLDPKELFLDATELRQKLEPKQRVELRALGKTAAQTDEDFQFGPSGNTVANLLGRSETVDSTAPLFLFPTAEKSADFEITSRSTRRFHGDVRGFAGSLDSAADGLLLVMQTLGLAERLQDMLREYGTGVSPESVLVGDLSGGFEIPSAGLTVYTETDVFGETQHAETRVTRPQQRRTKSNLGAFISDFRDLKPGDFVVHVDHGIGRFEGLQTIETGGTSREFMLL
ncbi:MAG TPA: CarD family transcriptional regulator, partial [Pyrinomonadaceae bacterium]|nr:CarD family transcriptional regulator [Pyrinomonadaceae bacterium]